MATNSLSANAAVGRSVVIRKVRRTILPVAFLLYAFNYMDRSSISYAQLTMGKELGIDVATYGAIAAIFFIAYVVLEVPSNMILAKVGARLWLARIAITWGLVTVATGFVYNVTQLYIARILLGIAEAGLFPGLILFLTYWFLNHDRGRAIGAMALAMPVALIVGSLSGGLILDHADWFGLSSWRWIFILQGLPPVLLGIWILLTLADRPNKAKWLKTDEKEWLEGAIADEYAAMPAEEHDHGSELRALKNPKILYLGLINALAGVATYGMTFFLPQVVSQLNPSYSPTNIGVFGAIPYACGAVVMLLLVRYADISGRRKFIVLACFATAIIGLIMTAVFRGSPVLGMLGLILLACGVIGNIPTYWALISEVLTKRQAVVGIAVINALASAGGFFGPFLIGKLATPGDTIVGMTVPMVALALAFVLLLFVKVPARTTAQTQSREQLHDVLTPPTKESIGRSALEQP